jgi:hypothetical protein
VRGAQAAEIVPLHGTGEALTDGGAGHIHELAFEVMVGGDFFTHGDEVFGVHAELRHLALGLHLGGGEMAAHGLARRLALAVPAPSCTAE